MSNQQKYQDQDAHIQSLSLNELKDWVDQAVFTKITLQEEEEEINSEDESWQSLPLSQLQELTQLAFLSPEEKAQKTGLSSTALQQIERNPLKVELATILQYCKGLNIAPQDFIACCQQQD